MHNEKGGGQILATALAVFTLGHILVAAIVNLTWGMNMIAMKIAIEALQPFTAAALRMLTVLAVTFPWLRIVPGRMKWLVLIGLLNGVLFIGLVNISIKVADNVSAIALAGQLAVPISLILSVVLFKERIAKARIVAIILTFAGVAVLVFDPAIAHERLGLLLAICSSVFWAMSTLVFRKLIGVPVMTTYAWISAFSVPPLLALALTMEPDSIWSTGVMPVPALLGVLFSGIGATVIGQGGMAWLLQRHPVSTIVPITLAAPLISVVSSVLWFDIIVTPQMWIGGCMTLAGVAIITVRTAQSRD